MIERCCRLGLLAVIALLLAACGSPPAKQPAAIEQAAKADQAAHRALRDGDLLRARELFHQTMLMQQALDNQPATGLAAVNLASVSHRLGDDQSALALLDGILNESLLQYPLDLRAAAALRKAVILADAGKPADDAWAQAQQECRQQCSFRAGIANLGGRLALARGDHATAQSLAGQALAADPPPEERANALRLMAAAEMAQGQQDKALADYQAALALDTSLGLSGRIAADLHGLADVTGKLGRAAEAAVFARRAVAVDDAIRSLPPATGRRAAP